jgi:hypothetical protein
MSKRVTLIPVEHRLFLRFQIPSTGYRHTAAQPRDSQDKK